MTWQGVALDGPRSRPYYLGAVVLALAGCHAGLPPLVPEPLAPLAPEAARSWAAQWAPTEPLLYQLRWTYETRQGGARGRATLRLVPPDSVRFDYRGPFGRSGAAVVFGDEVQWAEPTKDLGALVETASLFWALIGVVRAPPPDAAVSGRQSSEEHVWRYARGLDTLTYVMRNGPPRVLLAELRHRGRAVGRVATEFSDTAAHVAESTMRSLDDPWVFHVTVQSVERLQERNAAMWQRE